MNEEKESNTVEEIVESQETTTPSLLDKMSQRGKAVLDARAKNLYVALRTEAQQRVSAAYSDVLALETEIATHQDLSPKNAHDLSLNIKDAPGAWVAKSLELQKKLYYARLAYSIALKWFNELFPAKDAVSLPEVAPIQGI